MKKLIFAAAFAAVICMAATSCNPKGSSEYELILSKPLKLEEKEGTVVTTVENEWNPDGSPAGSQKKVGNELVYVDDEYVYENKKITFNRSYYEDGRVAYVEKHIQEYLDPYWMTAWSSKTFRETGGAEELVESIEVKYNSNGFRTGYVHTKNKVIYEELSQFVYDSYSVSYLITGSSVAEPQKSVTTYLGYNYNTPDKIVVTSQANPKNVITTQKYIYENGYLQGYQIFKGDSEKPSEERKNYKVSGNSGVLESQSYDTVWYDDSGAVTRSVSTSQTYDIIKIKVTN